LTKLPAIDINVSADVTTYFDFSFERLQDNYAIILATRTGAGAQGATNLTVKGRPFKKGKIQRRVPRAVPITGYNDIDTERTYVNPFIQTFTTASTVGQYQLVFNKYSIKPIRVIAPHNPALEPNTFLDIDDGETTLHTIIVRTIETKWRATDGLLEDTITGWDF